ncbi:MAG: hypothetical protein K0R44_3421 [Thermomicrobiales bacterium]|nr:hypothetical protein [Thermomicrobiales bacterium]
MRSLFQTIVRLVPVLAMLAVTPVLASAQAEIDPAFSDTLIRDLGYPEVTINVSPEGVSAPETLPAGRHLITLVAPEGLVGYVNIMQPPTGLSEKETTRLALDAAANDLVQPDWVYLGGTNTPNPGQNASFVIDLQPGEFQWAASTYSEGGADEIMHLSPLTVTAAGATPVTDTALSPPAPGVVLEMTDDLEYLVTPDPVPKGPQIWEFTNTGMHSAHHVVMFRVPDGTTSKQIMTEFSAMMSGTPPAGEPVMARVAWVGYAALQSGGQTTWAEFDLEPATYAVICFIIDPATGRPHVLDGMVTVFDVA